MTNESKIEARKRRFANPEPTSGGLLSRGSKAMSHQEAQSCLNTLKAQSAEIRSWNEFSRLRESTIKTPLRADVLKLGIEICVAQHKIELESTLRALLDLPTLSPSERHRYELLYTVESLGLGNATEALKYLDNGQIRGWFEAIADSDLIKGVLIVSQEQDTLVKTAMLRQIPKLAEHAVKIINKAYRSTSRDDAIAQVREHASQVGATFATH